MIGACPLLPYHERQDLLYCLPDVAALHPREGPSQPQDVPRRFSWSDIAQGHRLRRILNFNAAVEPSLLEDVASCPRGCCQFKKTPVLSPVPLFDGTVKMMLFGRPETNHRNPAIPGRNS